MKKSSLLFLSILLVLVGWSNKLNGQPPLNDACPGVTLSVSGSCSFGAVTTGDLAGATQSLPGAPCTSPVGINIMDVWYNFVAISTTQVINVVPSWSLNVVFQVYSTSCGGTSINCSDAVGTGLNETTTLTGLTIGSTYWIRVYSANSTLPATTTFTIAVESTPSNDNCLGATSLTSSATCAPTYGCDYNGTPSGIPVSGSCGGSTAEEDVWYFFVAATTSETVQVAASTYFDPVFELFSGSCSGLASLGCNGIGGVPGTTISQTFTGLTVGTVYYVRVYDYNSTSPVSPNFTICVTNAGSVGIDEQNSISGITISPNPASSELRISNEGLRIESIYIYNVLGECVKSSNRGHQTSVSFDVSALYNGIYFIEVKNENGNIINRKIIINN